MPAQIENLKRWIESRQADDWVADNGAKWGHAEWLALLDRLKAGPYWPMAEEDVGAYLEVAARKYRRRRDRTVGKTKDDALGTALWWYVTGLAVIGLAGGFFAGASRTAIVATLLPLLFAIVGGTSGVYLATADLSVPATLARLQWLGRAFGVFGLGCLLGSAIGISLRLGFAHPPSENELTTLWHGTTQDALQLAALRFKLQALGASPREQDLFLRTASEAMHDAVVPIPGEHVREVASAALNLSNELKSILQKATQAHQPVPQDANKVVAALDLFYHQTEPWSKSAMPRSLYKNAVESVWYWMSHVAMPQDPALATWARQVGFQTDRLDELYQKLRAEFELRDDLDWELGGATSDRLDKFLQLMGKSLKASPDRDDLMPAIDMDTKPAATKSAAEEKDADKK